MKLIKLDDLKQKLDEIDFKYEGEALSGLQHSRYKILIAQWEKGKVIGEYTGGKIPSWMD